MELDALRGVSVLIVDDSDVNLRVLVEQATEWGLRAETCAASVDALQVLREAHTAGTAFDLVIADHQMPGLDGAGLAAAVRGDARLCDTVFVMLTSLGHPRESEGVRRGHIDACLTKPVRHERLLRALATAWTRRCETRASARLRRGAARLTRHGFPGQWRTTARGRLARQNPVHKLNGVPPGASRAPGGGYKDRPDQLRWRGLMPHALIVDDSAATLSALVELVTAEGFTTSAALTVDRAKVELSRQSPDIVLADLNLPDGTGMNLLDAVERSGASPAVVFITGQASVDTAVEALRRGVTDYLTKPLDVNRLREILNDVSRTGPIAEEIGELRAKQRGTGRFAGIVGRSEPILKLGELLGRIAPSSASVLVSGESGSGKEVVARTIHELSRRRHGPFVPVNCGAISPTLMESELFGHEKGSFTGAERRHRGYFEQATRGTLFLDEITEMPAELQVKLLRVLETSTFTRVGGEQSLSVDVRIVAASNRDIQEAIDQGKLREDLYYRLKVFQLHLPPLRERPDDIPLLAQHFLDDLERVEKVKKRLGSDALELMRTYRWPGNVRELKNVMHSGYILSGDVITADCLPSELHGRTQEARPAASVEGMVTVRPGTTIADAERLLIFATLRQFGGDKTRAAEALGISLKTLYNRLHAYEKDDRAPEEAAALEGDEPALN